MAPDRSNPPPADHHVVDGIPARSPNRAAWKYILAAIVFALWVAFLIYCAVVGAP